MHTKITLNQGARKVLRLFCLAPIFLLAASLGIGSASAANITVNAAQVLRTVDARHFGLNTAIWDGNLDTPQDIAFLDELGVEFLRFPGVTASSPACIDAIFDVNLHHY